MLTGERAQVRCRGCTLCKFYAPTKRELGGEPRTLGEATSVLCKENTVYPLYAQDGLSTVFYTGIALTASAQYRSASRRKAIPTRLWVLRL